MVSLVDCDKRYTERVLGDRHKSLILLPHLLMSTYLRGINNKKELCLGHLRLGVGLVRVPVMGLKNR